MFFSRCSVKWEPIHHHFNMRACTRAPPQLSYRVTHVTPRGFEIYKLSCRISISLNKKSHLGWVRRRVGRRASGFVNDVYMPLWRRRLEIKPPPPPLHFSISRSIGYSNKRTGGWVGRVSKLGNNLRNYLLATEYVIDWFTDCLIEWLIDWLSESVSQ